ncbi:non-ribosomal peptide synthetase/type I polyketide synthase [Myxococcus sp. CA040A]|uniref:non-ribosomal peptide synthetase/type I polyketide synthase n=1 Tax=Myxococcus sp. CA040A TaxID=2741738 RepID=UPI00157A57ED|nr:non-ribosomal peptide synthetase/type I polyketide synthase [Myxococcus sp. CA040A]NTX01462.1 amino acid adenylation domain-containing protein [Myxococcus sp. CA040A]
MSRDSGVTALLTRLFDLGIRLWVEGGRLAVDAPEGALTADLRAELSARKAELIALLDDSMGDARAAELPALICRPEERDEPFPLTDIQQAYWVGRGGDFELGAAIHVYVEIDSETLDPARFGEAWRRLIQRHEMLRAVALPDGTQRILRDVPDYEVAVEDYRALSPEERQRRLDAHRERLAQQILPLDTWPLFEIRAVRLEEGHRLYFSIDCTFVDSWSVQVLFRELIQLYADPDATLDPREHGQSFRDYVLATRALQETELYRRSVDYWRGRIATLPPAPDLPRVQQVGAPRHPHFVRREARIERARWERLVERARELQLTPTGLLLACYAEVIAHFSKSPHFTLNVPLYNRLPLHEDVGKMVGTFSSFLLVEVDHRAGGTFQQRARALQEQLFKDLEHRYIGGVEILRQMFRERGKISGALMPVVLTSFASGVEGWDSCWVDHLGRAFGRVVHSVTQTPQVWIDHQLVFQDGGVFYNWDAADELFAPGLLDAMFASYQRLIDRLVDEPDVVHEKPLRLSAPQVAAGPRRDGERSERLLHSRFVEQATAQPDRPAVIAPGRTLSYGELLQRCTALAHALTQAGARKNHPVAVVMEKGWEQVVATLACSIAGAPYLPIDAGVPGERLKQLLEDSTCEHLVTQPWLEPRLEWPATPRRFTVEPLEPTSGFALPVAPVQGADDLAVIIYTSGSTGRPGGVMLAHRGLVHALDETLREFSIGPEDRVLALTALNHDMSMFDVFGMLSAGGAIVFCEATARKEPARWAELLRTERITVWNSVPGMMEMLLAHASGRPEPLAPALRLAFMGGDWIPLDLPERLRALVPGVQPVSVGGPTETSLWNIWFPIGKVDPDWKSIPYGRPIADTRYHVMDETLRERPLWVPGELCCSGVGVAHGYWRNEARTRERFVTHPVTGERLYRTGDLGRLLPDGTVEILGRVDFQLSILGHRVEPGEIEAALRLHPEVSAAVVVADGDRHAPRLLAYVVRRAGATLSQEPLRRFLGERLADHMVPSIVVFLEQLPLGPTGKVDRAALPRPEALRVLTESRTDDGAPAHEAEAALAAIVRDVLQLPEVERRKNFFELGANSVHLVRINARIRQELGADIPTVELFQNANLAALAAHLGRVRRGDTGGPSQRVTQARADTLERSPIAIIGMSARLPGAPDVEAYWKNLVEGVESVRFFTDEELRAQGLAREMIGNPHYVKAGAVLDDIAGFDADFFGLTAREALLTDPQQRLFLECVWESLERAGYRPDATGKKVGVFAGKSLSNYIYPELDLTQPLPYFQRLFGNDKDFVATQVSYKLNLTGPSITLQTACSTSLVAVTLACQSLWNRDCEMALAGGVSIKVPHHLGYLAEPGSGMFSPDGHCRPFDSQAQGILPASGAGVVVLKRLDEALADGDAIHAVILGAAVNNDGGDKVGFSAPNRDGQAEVIARAQAMAGIPPETVGYIEAHGTGTPLGDPMEIAALTQAFRLGTPAKGFCVVGSAKSNFGHLDTAAGVAGLIKAALTVERGLIPPTLHFERPNPAIGFEQTPFYVNARLQPWPEGPHPRRAGVSSFGVGGTNAHVVLEAAPRRDTSPSRRPVHVLPLSARSPRALEALGRRFERFLASASDSEFADICYTAGLVRSHFSHRLAVVGRTAEELRERLRASLDGTMAPGVSRGQAQSDQPPRIAFLFTGHGAQYEGMGRALHDTSPVFREALERVAALLRTELETPLLAVLYGSESHRLTELAYAQPAIFAVEYALTELWRSWGIEPDAVLGHSLGEYVAAMNAGVFSLEDAVRLVSARGRLMEQLALEGETIVVLADEARVREALTKHDGRASIGSINAPQNVVVSGEGPAVRQLTDELVAQGIEVKKLEASRAAHSHLMDPMLPAFEKVARTVTYRSPTRALISNLTGRLAGAEVATPEYWVRHLREPVQLAEGMRTLAEQGTQVFLEIGPKPTLVWMGRECLPVAQAQWLSSLRKGHEDWHQLLECLAALYTHGAPVSWRGYEQAEARRRVALPTYPFERQRFWSDEAGPRSTARREDIRTTHPLLGARVAAATLQPGEMLFESRVGATSPSYLGDHRALGTALLPGTAYLELALAAGAVALPNQALVVEDLALEQALILPEQGEVTLQTVVRTTGEQVLSIEVFRREETHEGESRWIRHASGKVRPTGAETLVPTRLEASLLQPSGLGTQPGEAHYTRARKLGAEFGESFRGLVELWSDDAGACARIEVPEQLRDEPKPHHVHPAVLDACLQLVGAVGPELKEGEWMLPASFGRVRVHRASLPNRLVSRVIPRSPLLTDVFVYDEAGDEVLRVEGFELKRVRGEAFLQGARPGLEDALYEPAWREQPRPVSEVTHRPSTWLLIADEQGVAEALRARVEEDGRDACVIARVGPRYERHEAHRFQLDPTNPEHFTRLLAELAHEERPLRQVTHLGSLDAPSDQALQTETLGEDLHRTCGGVLHLVQALVARNEPPPVLQLVTRGVQEGNPGTGSLLWGLGQVIALEHPELGCRRVDLAPSTGPDASRELLAELRCESQEAQVRLEGGSRQVARLRVAEASRAEGALRPDATYLITGGFGRLGRLVAQSMVDRGARSLALLGRNVPPGDDAGIAALRSAGARILCLEADVSCLESVSAALDEVRGLLPPLRGVVHAAGAVHDGPMRTQSWESFAQVLAPKVQGAWNLHTATRGHTLDFFVLFSSVSSLLGNAGQANYAAANAFLDGLARHRRSLGLPGLSVAWGPWSGEGTAASDVFAERLRRQGLGLLSPIHGLTALHRLWAHARPNIAVVPIDWKQLSGTASSTFLMELVSRGDSLRKSGAAQQGFRQRIEAAPASEQQPLLRAHVREQVAAVLGLTPSAVGVDRGLFDLGLDSLGSLEIRNRLQASLPCTLPSVVVFKHPSVDQLTTYLATEVLRLASATPRPQQEASEELPLDEVVRRLERKLEDMG